MLNSYKGQTDLELAKVRPLIDSLKSKMSHSIGQLAVKQSALTDLATKIKTTEEHMQKQKLDPRHKEDIKDEIKKLKDKKEQLEAEKKKIENDINEAEAARADAEKLEKTVKERSNHPVSRVEQELVVPHRSPQANSERKGILYCDQSAELLGKYFVPEIHRYRQAAAVHSREQ